MYYAKSTAEIGATPVIDRLTSSSPPLLAGGARRTPEATEDLRVPHPAELSRQEGARQMSPAGKPCRLRSPVPPCLLQSS